MSEFKARAPRKDIDVPVALTFDDPPERCIGSSRNMSSTGMLVLSQGERPPGTRLSFESLPLSGTGEVVWSRPSGAGRATFLGMRFITVTRVDEDLVPTEMDEISVQRTAWRQALAGERQKGPTFRQATDLLLQNRVSIAEIAFTLGAPVDSIRQARADRNSHAYRDLPDDWRNLLAELCLGRGPVLDELAAKLSQW